MVARAGRDLAKMSSVEQKLATMLARLVALQITQSGRGED